MNIDKNKIEEIDKRIEKHQKEFITKMNDAMRKSKDFAVGSVEEQMYREDIEKAEKRVHDEKLECSKQQEN